MKIVMTLILYYFIFILIMFFFFTFLVRAQTSVVIFNLSIRKFKKLFKKKKTYNDEKK